MTKEFKTKKRMSVQNLIARVTKKTVNNNVSGLNTLALKKAEKSKALNTLFHELEAICGDRQAQQIIDTVRKANSDEASADVMPLCALGETLQFVRNEVKASLKAVKKNRFEGNIVDLDSERNKQRLEQMMPVYWMVMHAFYSHYNKFMKAN
jgi:ribosomal protein S17E